MSDHKTYILLFDGVCNLCNATVQFTIKRDRKRKFKFAALQSESGQAMLKKFNLNTRDFDSFVLIQDDKYYVRSSAVLQVFKELGGIWKLLYALILLPVPIRDFFYNIISKTRYRIFGRRDTCMVPTPELKERFLS